MKLIGWPDAITAYEWIVAKATHKLEGSGGYLTSLELENKATAGGHSAVNDDETQVFKTDQPPSSTVPEARNFSGNGL